MWKGAPVAPLTMGWRMRVMSRELEVLRQEYKRAVDSPIFDEPSDYCILLDLIQDRINEIEGDDNE
jgi:hypothetical protein